ncbi:hypothetical protein QNH98_06435 [Myroides sp. mNGS23_01]|nr:hypothetical protein [Myroides sp. mNGS23_01]WHT40239.1 hypothetical protein QNH98_06435 [Myroides sp. mNGS23_01]
MRKRLEPKQIITLGTSIQLISALVLFGFIVTNVSIYFQLVPLFFFVLPLGMLFPTSTTLALSPFKAESGIASALFGASQLAFTFLTSVLLNTLNNGSMYVVALSLAACALCSLLINTLTQKHK